MNIVSSDAVLSECYSTHRVLLVCHVHALDTF